MSCLNHFYNYNYQIAVRCKTEERGVAGYPGDDNAADGGEMDILMIIMIETGHQVVPAAAGMGVLKMCRDKRKEFLL